jgi:hypothetical protein
MLSTSSFYFRVKHLPNSYITYYLIWPIRPFIDQLSELVVNSVQLSRLRSITYILLILLVKLFSSSLLQLTSRPS